MSSVNVLCAPPNGKNPGMASVDLAFEQVAQRIDADVKYWRLWDQSEWVDSPGGSSIAGEGCWVDDLTGLTYHRARGNMEEFLQSDAIVFWGDFHHMAVYLDQTADVLHRRMAAMTRLEAADTAARHLLLVDQGEDVLGRTFTFGTTLGFNTARDYQSSYGQQLSNFIRGVSGAWFRDGYSARIGELLRAPRTQSCLGSDAALIGGGTTHDPNRAQGLGVFIGRSSVKPETISRIGRSLASHIDEAPTWLPWGEQPAMWPMWGRKRLRFAWPELEGSDHHRSPKRRIQHLRSVATTELAPPIVPTANQLFERIAGCRAILTDTYHLAVNAWRIGTPAVLLHDRPRSGSWNVNSGSPYGRDKRHDLYSQLDALPLLLDTSSRIMPSDLSRLGDQLMNGQDRKYIHERALTMGEQARQRITDSLGMKPGALLT